jgi:cobalamin biosynthesis Mg chelatase CobN
MIIDSGGRLIASSGEVVGSLVKGTTDIVNKAGDVVASVSKDLLDSITKTGVELTHEAGSVLNTAITQGSTLGQAVIKQYGETARQAISTAEKVANNAISSAEKVANTAITQGANVVSNISDDITKVALNKNTNAMTISQAKINADMEKSKNIVQQSIYAYNAQTEQNKSNTTKSIIKYVIIGVIVLVIIISIIVIVVTTSSSSTVTNTQMTNKPIAMHLRPGYDPEKQPYIDATGYKYYSRLMV